MTPRLGLIFLFALAGLPFALAVFEPSFAFFGLLANIAVAIVAIADLVISPPTAAIVVEREVSDVLSVGTRNRVTIRASNRSASPIEVEFHDETPVPGHVEDLPAAIELEPWKERELDYWFEPHRRGKNRFEAVHLRFMTRLGLWTRVERRPMPFAVRIFPDIRAVREFDLLALKNRLEEAGLKQYRIRGQGGEFERLREYRREDEMRHIDWKATAKHRRLISREYNVERNQNVVILLDCGRSMCNETDGISHLDSGLNAATILSYVALGQGDNVSLVAFSDRIERFVGPLHGKPAVQTIVREMYDVQPRWEASDYGLACDELLRRQRKRALVVLITHTLDEQHLWSIGSYLKTLTTPHVLVCVFIRDRALSALASRVPEDDVEAFQSAGAAELMTTQTRKLAELRDSGVLVIETFPNELNASLINQYLDLKARHLL